MISMLSHSILPDQSCGSVSRRAPFPPNFSRIMRSTRGQRGIARKPKQELEDLFGIVAIGMCLTSSRDSEE